MTRSTPSARPGHADTPWQSCTGLSASAIDGAAALIVMEVLIDALTRLPDGQAALTAACRRQTGNRRGDQIGATPVEIAAGALALAIIETARGLDEPATAAA